MMVEMTVAPMVEYLADPKVDKMVDLLADPKD
jgi:hypothetical protein